MLFKRYSKEKDILQKANKVLELAENALMKAKALCTQTEYETNLLSEVLKKFADKTEASNTESEPADVEALQLGKDKPIKPLSLKALREEKGLSLRRMADMVGCSKSVISCWEQGVVKPPYAKIVLLANFFGRTISEVEEAVKVTADENFFKKEFVNNKVSLNSLDLRGLRQKYGYKQSDIAKNLHVAPNTVSAWETGANRIQSVSILALSLLYDAPIEEIEMAAKKSYRGE